MIRLAPSTALLSAGSIVSGSGPMQTASSLPAGWLSVDGVVASVPDGFSVLGPQPLNASEKIITTARASASFFMLFFLLFILHTVGMRTEPSSRRRCGRPRGLPRRPSRTRGGNKRNDRSFYERSKTADIRCFCPGFCFRRECARPFGRHEIAFYYTRIRPVMQGMSPVCNLFLPFFPLFYLLQVVAGRVVAGGNLAEGGLLLRAPFGRVGAAGAEPAAAGRVHRAGHVPLEHDALAGAAQPGGRRRGSPR